MKRKTSLLVIILGLFLYQSALAFDVLEYVVSNIKLFPLKNIERIYVRIQPLNKEATAIGLAEEKLKTFIENRLKKEGIKISEEYEAMVKNYPVLNLNIDVSGPVYNINLGVDEMVILFRDKSVNCIATTWNKSALGNHRSDAGVITSDLSKILDQFIDDYQKVNPKR